MPALVALHQFCEVRQLVALAAEFQLRVEDPFLVRSLLVDEALVQESKT